MGPHLLSVFFFNDTATTEIYTLSLHDALPILPTSSTWRAAATSWMPIFWQRSTPAISAARRSTCSTDRKSTRLNSSHMSISYAVFCLKKKNMTRIGNGSNEQRDQRLL